MQADSATEAVEREHLLARLAEHASPQFVKIAREQDTIDGLRDTMKAIDEQLAFYASIGLVDESRA